jgi:PAS domain S-box-containing protein
MHDKPTYEELQQRVNELEAKETSISQAYDRLSRLMDKLPALISYADLEHHYRANNLAYENWFGLSRNDVIGRHVRDVLGEVIYAEIKPHIEKALSGNKVTYETIIDLKDGGKRYVLANYIPDFDESGNVVGLFALVNDITELKQAEEAMRESEEKYHAIFEQAGRKGSQEA